MSSFVTRRPLIAAAAFLALVTAAPAFAQGELAGDHGVVTIKRAVPVAAQAERVADKAADVEPNYGADPDPDHFDRAGIERWWAQYRKAHPTR